MKEVHESREFPKMDKETARFNRKVMWYVTKRTAKMVLVTGAAILATKAVFDMAVEHEVNNRISS